MALSKTFPVGVTLSAADVNGHLVNRVPNEGDPYDTDWIDLSLVNGWQETSSNLRPQVRRVGLGVYFRGRATGGTGTVATVPEGMRPGRTYSGVVRDGGGTTAGPCLVIANGDISPSSAVTQPNLDSLHYLAEG